MTPPAENPVAVMEQWLRRELGCRAGRREFALGRYRIVAVETRQQVGAAVRAFAAEARAYARVGLLLVDGRRQSPAAASVEASITRLADLVAVAAGASATELIDGGLFAMPLHIRCPVTASPTVFTFFGVSFCPEAACPADPLFDPALSTPMPCVNITSDAFSFAMFVRDICLRDHGCAPHALTDQAALSAHLQLCARVWQAMSKGTIRFYGQRTAHAACPVALSGDERHWHAPHQDPVFAELAKQPHQHEMPVLYAQRLVAMWERHFRDGTPVETIAAGQEGGERLCGS